jgi:glycosyltransferase involved in cell wall biosynthesis
MEKRDLKISFFLPSLHGGGAERVVVNLIKEFAKKGISVDLVLANAKGPYLREIPKEVKIFDLKSRRVHFALPKLVRYFKKEKPEIFVSSLSHANIVSIIAKKIARSKTKLFLREDTTLSLAYYNSKSFKTKIMPFLMKLLYPYSDLVIAVSKGIKDDLEKFAKLPENKIKVIYNPIITQDLFIKAKEPVDHPWFAPDSPPVILGVGRLTKAKDFPTLLKAFALVRKEIDSRLVILGEGDDRKSLEKLSKDLDIEEYLWMPGFVDNPYKYMSKASVFVLSSIYEGLPTVLVEALALSCPVVSTDCPSGPDEILENGKYGKLVPVGDHIAMAQAIEEILTGKVHYMVPKSVLEQYTLEFSSNQYIKLLFENVTYKYEE